jgi:citrate synthase
MPKSQPKAKKAAPVKKTASPKSSKPNGFSYLKKDIIDNNTIDELVYADFDVKRGLRNKDGSGVIAGLTRISSVIGARQIDGMVERVEGILKYRGTTIEDIVGQFNDDSRHCFEYVTFLLLTGKKPSSKDLDAINAFMADNRTLPKEIVDGVIKGLPGKDVMNKVQTSVCSLYGFDKDPDSNDPYENFLKALLVTAKLPTIIAYSYLAAHKPKAKFVTPPANMSLAEGFLYMLYEGKAPSKMEARILDLCLVLHAEHGGGNNSAFATYVVTSSGSDMYSSLTAAIGSLKGPLHGAANSKVMKMMEDVKSHLKKWDDKAKLRAYLKDILEKKAYDKSGKIYGLGHAVYTKSDPRANLLKKQAVELAKKKKRLPEYQLYLDIAKEGPDVFQKLKGPEKIIAPNVDFFSGFVYDCLDIPKEIYTPIFAMARVVGWASHRIEEILSGKRIIRPGFKYVGK